MNKMENQIIRIDKNNLLQILKAHYGKQQAEVSISTKKNVLVFMKMKLALLE